MIAGVTTNPSEGRRAASMADTGSNLEATFAGESRANRRCLAFAEHAERGGFPDSARRFHMTAAAGDAPAKAYFVSQIREVL
jgi:rubrerythrin